jgi:hypothetical protein
MAHLTDLVFPVASHPELASPTKIRAAEVRGGSAPSLGMPRGGEVSASPQGKGVGLFALSTSPADIGLMMEEKIKDPKVCCR